MLLCFFHVKSKVQADIWILSGVLKHSAQRFTFDFYSRSEVQNVGDNKRETEVDEAQTVSPCLYLTQTFLLLTNYIYTT